MPVKLALIGGTSFASPLRASAGRASDCTHQRSLARLLGLSHQRVYQLTQNEAEER
jgi:hypothetical protein